MNELAQDKVKGMFHVALISLTIVVVTATLLRVGLAPRAEASNNKGYLTSQVVKP